MSNQSNFGYFLVMQDAGVKQVIKEHTEIVNTCAMYMPMFVAIRSAVIFLTKKRESKCNLFSNLKYLPKIIILMIIVFPCFKEQPYNMRFAQTSYLVEKIVTEDKVTFEAVEYVL